MNEGQGSANSLLVAAQSYRPLFLRMNLPDEGRNRIEIGDAERSLSRVIFGTKKGFYM